MDCPWNLWNRKRVLGRNHQYGTGCVTVLAANLEPFWAFLPNINWFRTQKVGSFCLRHPSLKLFCSKHVEMQSGSLDRTKVPSILNGTSSRTRAYLVENGPGRPFLHGTGFVLTPTFELVWLFPPNINCFGTWKVSSQLNQKNSRLSFGTIVSVSYSVGTLCWW